MSTARGLVVGVQRAKRPLQSIDVSSGAPVTPIDSRSLDFPRPHGAPPIDLRPFLEAEDKVRGQLLQLVIDAASVPEPRRPRGLSDHVVRLWEAVEQLLFTGAGADNERRRLLDPAGVRAQRRTAEKLLMLVDRPDSDWAAPGILHDSVAGIIIDRLNVVLSDGGPQFEKRSREMLERVHDDLLFIAPTRKGLVIKTTVAGRILELIQRTVNDDSPAYASTARRAMHEIRDLLVSTARHDATPALPR